MKTIKIENAKVNLEGIVEYVNKNKEQVKIISGNVDVEAVIIDVQTWNCWQKLIEDIENIRLLELAKSRKSSQFISLEELIIKEGFDSDEIIKLAEKLELE